jgi:hypothetical protein
MAALPRYWWLGIPLDCIALATFLLPVDILGRQIHGTLQVRGAYWTESAFVKYWLWAEDTSWNYDGGVAYTTCRFRVSVEIGGNDRYEASFDVHGPAAQTWLLDEPPPVVGPSAEDMYAQLELLEGPENETIRAQLLPVFQAVLEHVRAVVSGVRIPTRGAGPESPWLPRPLEYGSVQQTVGHLYPMQVARVPALGWLSGRLLWLLLGLATRRIKQFVRRRQSSRESPVTDNGDTASENRPRIRGEGPAGDRE